MTSFTEFSSFLGRTPEQAYAIVNSDEWFELNRDNDAVQRFVRYETDATGHQIIKVEASKVKKDGFIQVDKTIGRNEPVEALVDGKFASFLFSLNGNLGPALQFAKCKQEFEDHFVQVTDQCEKGFLIFLCWLKSHVSPQDVEFADWLTSDEVFSLVLKEYLAITGVPLKVEALPAFHKFRMSPLGTAYYKLFEATEKTERITSCLRLDVKKYEDFSKAF